MIKGETLKDLLTNARKTFKIGKDFSLTLSTEKAKNILLSSQEDFDTALKKYPYSDTHSLEVR